MNGTVTGAATTDGRATGGRAALPLTRGRRVALVLGVPACLALTGFAGLNFVAEIGEGHFPVSYTFPGAGRYSATVSGGGSVEIVFTRAPRDVTVRTQGGNVTIVVPAGTTQYNVSATTDGGGVTDSVPLNTSSPNQITVTSGGGDIAVRQAS